jgi:sialic acid synthase
MKIDTLQKNKNEIYVIAEIGQNHNGDMDICKRLIDQLVVYSYDEISGERLNTVNAIKLTKRDMEEELSNEGMTKSYTGKNSFGKTYGEHREFLEFSYEQHCELSDYIRSKGVDFIDTLCSPNTVKLVEMTHIDKIKIASRDLTNIPLLEKISKTENDVIISTGMAGIEEIDNSLQILDDGKRHITILHCLSQYPAEYSRLNLSSIKKLQEIYGDKYTIGYSDHSMGIHIPLAAVAMGAKVIEKHVTLDKTMRGTDQAGSAEPHEMKTLIHNIRTFEKSIGVMDIFKDAATYSASEKLERSLAVKRNMVSGEFINMGDIHMISPGDGLKWSSLNDIIGKKINSDLQKNTILTMKMIN